VTRILLSTLGEYHVWANKPYIETVSTLTDEEFEKDLGIPFGSIKERCIHILGAVMKCLRLMEIKSTPSDYKELFDISKDDIIIKWLELDELLLNTCKTGLEGNLTLSMSENESATMSKEDFMFQYINHTTYHRGQLKLALKVIQKEDIVDTDYLFFVYNNK
jgi:uncharacterized damage-inducible protein DinB